MIVNIIFTLAMIIVFTIFFIRLRKRIDIDYLKEATQGLTKEQRIVWMQAHEEAKTIGMGHDVSTYMLATSEMNDVDKAIFLIKIRSILSSKKSFKRMRRVIVKNQDGHKVQYINDIFPLIFQKKS